MSDKRISRAAHPIINAWRCQVENTIHQGKLFVSTIPESTVVESCILDNDDNGESAAGGRLAHLLQILVCIYHSVYSGIRFHYSIFFSGCQKCPGHRYALLWRDPFRGG